MSSLEEADADIIGENDSYTEDEIIDGEEIDEEEEENQQDGEENEQDTQDQEVTDRIGDLSNNLSSSVSKQQQVLRAHISILVSALGGNDFSSETETYKLGDDALACLKDIKRWLKTVDEQDKSWDVALACAETGLVINDLIPILCQWETDSLLRNVKNKNFMERVALSVVELLVPLTWPLLLTKESTQNQINHYFNLSKAQLTYKKLILHYQGGKALRAVVRLTLPIVLKTKAERNARDNAILRLCIYLFRNVLKIEPARATISSKAASKGNQVQDNLPTGVNMEDISASSAISSYDKNNVLQFLLTITNSLGSDFDEQMLNIGCLECLYLLTDGVNYQTLFKKQERKETNEELVLTESTALLKDLLLKEQKIKKTIIKGTSSRHGRFGTLLSLQTVDNGRLTISGQKGIADRSSTLSQLDSTKEWRPTIHQGMNMKFSPATELEENLGKNVGKTYLSESSSKILVNFIDDFIEGCFNPLSYSLRRKFLSEEDATFNRLQFFELVNWIIGYETEKRINCSNDEAHENGYFTNVLEDDFFTLIITTMRKSTESRINWSLVQSCMKCFKQILSFADLIGSTSTDPNDQLISHNLKHRLFSKELTLDMLAALPKNAYKISEDYVKTVVELTYVVLKTLEKFSKDDDSMYIAAKRKRPERIDDSDDEEEVSVKTKSLNFQKYQVKFIHRDIIQTHISLFERYEDVSEQDLKRCLSYFYRVFYTCERHLDLYRIDFMILLHQMTGNGPKSLPRSSPLKREVISFTKYYMKKLVDSLDKAPSLFMELCFNSHLSMTSRIKTFLEKGEVVKEEKVYLVAREIVFKRGYDMDLDRKFAIVVSLMIDHGERDWIEYVLGEITPIIEKRNKLVEEQRLLTVAEGEHDPMSSVLFSLETLKIASEKIKRLLIRNLRLRLLLKTVGFELPETITQQCELPSDITTDHLKACLESITKYLNESVKFSEGNTAADYIAKAQDDDDYDDEINYGRRDFGTYEEDEDDIAFTTGQMDIRSLRVNDLDKLDELESQLSHERHKRPLGKARRKNKGKIVNGEKKRHRHRLKNDRLEMHDISDVENDSQLRFEKRHEYKSSEFVQDSSDDENDDFFAKEQFLRQLLELHGGVLKPEHAKLFVDDSWKSYKITITGEVKENATAKDTFTESMITQESQFLSDADMNESDGEVNVATTQNVTQLSQTPMDEDSSDSSSDEMLHNSQSSVTSAKRSQSDDDDDDDSTFVSRKKMRRVLDSDDEDE